MKKIIIIFLGILIFHSCNYKNEKSVISLSLIDSMSVEINHYIKAKNQNRVVLIKYTDLPIFVKLNDGSYVDSNPFEIYEVYIKSYKNDFDKFNIFLNEVANNNFKLNKNDFQKKTFGLDITINKKFNEFEINDFLNYYSMKDASENKPYLNKKIKTENEYLTISYLLFTKGYYLGEDDLRGRSYIYRFDKVIR